MAILQLQILQNPNNYISVFERDESYFQYPFYIYPVKELVWEILKYGKRIIEDKIDFFREDDMVLIGENLLHVWKNDINNFNGQPSLKAKVLNLSFNKNFFETNFSQLDEFLISKL